MEDRIPKGASQKAIALLSIRDGLAMELPTARGGPLACAEMASSNCLRENDGKARISSCLKFSHPLTGLVDADPSQPMCVTCSTSVGSPISISLSISSSSL